MTYGHAVTMTTPFEPAVERVREALARQGFGILCEIDVRATLRAKIGADVGPYLILGACNPPLAYQGLTAEPSLGLLLPCNVVVRAVDDFTTRVEAVDPAAFVTVTGNAGLEPVARAVAGHLAAVLDELGDPALPAGASR
ncbi:MAG TPA: DUF302 domain-containing protein [Frankiaceae bacterium]|nr:DUF302 domain-containing protein [Frankiaceae bacterium]